MNIIHANLDFFFMENKIDRVISQNIVKWFPMSFPPILLAFPETIIFEIYIKPHKYFGNREPQDKKTTVISVKICSAVLCL